MSNEQSALLDPLPAGWERGTNSAGQTFWTNSARRITTYYGPLEPNPHPDGFEATPVEGGPLPEGWEVLGRNVDGRHDVVYLNHNTHTSTSIDPRLGPLPDGWEQGCSPTGQTFWAHAEQKIKTYYDPRKDNPHASDFTTVPVEGDPLPDGWEVVGKEVDGRIAYSYLNHNTHTSTDVDPRG